METECKIKLRKSKKIRKSEKFFTKKFSEALKNEKR